jgi:hypothetical protein
VPLLEASLLASTKTGMGVFVGTENIWFPQEADELQNDGSVGILQFCD